MRFIEWHDLPDPRFKEAARLARRARVLQRQAGKAGFDDESEEQGTGVGPSSPARPPSPNLLG